MTKIALTQVSFVAAVAILTGCSKSAEEAAPAASQGDEASPEETARMSDGQLLQVISMVDTGEIQQAQIALTKASSPQVRNFASDMVEQHTRAKQQTAALAAQNGLVLRSSPTSDKLQRDGTSMLETLQRTDTRQFDTVYIQGQVTQHDEVLKMLDDKLIPGAANARVRQQLSDARTLVQQHLRHATELKDALSTNTGLSQPTGPMAQ